MQPEYPEWDVPSSGAALLITPVKNGHALTRLLSLGIMALSPVLRRQPKTYLYRFDDGRDGIVITRPAPQPLLDLICDLLEVTVSEVRLEELQHLRPSVRLSPAGIRVYLTADQQLRPIRPAGDGPLN